MHCDVLPREPFKVHHIVCDVISESIKVFRKSLDLFSSWPSSMILDFATSIFTTFSPSDPVDFQK